MRITGEQLELVVFTDALPRDSAWRPAPNVKSRERTNSVARTPMDTTRVVLLGCVKLKRDHRSAAKDLYVSPLWNGRRTYAESFGGPWFILSAKYGLLDPDETIAPYDVALAELPSSARRAWGEQVVHALEERLGRLDGITFEVHAGQAYRAAIAPFSICAAPRKTSRCSVSRWVGSCPGIAPTARCQASRLLILGGFTPDSPARPSGRPER